MKINFKWIIKNLPIWLIGLIIIFLILGGFEGVVNGIILGQFPNLVDASSNRLILFLIQSSGIFCIVYTALVLKNILLNYARKILRVSLKKTMLLSSFSNHQETEKGLNQISNDAAKIDENYFSLIAEILSTAVAAVISTIYVLQVNILMGIIFVTFSCLSLIPMLFGKKKLGRLGDEWSKSNTKVMHTAGDWLRGFRDILQYNAQRTFFNHVSSTINQSESILLKQENLQWLVQYVNLLFTILALVGPWAIGFYFIVNHLFNVTISALLSLTLSANSVVQNFRILMQCWSEVAGTTNIRKIDEINEDILEQSKIELCKPNIKLENINVTYDERVIYNNLNFDIPYGSKILLQGPSGAGKSTFLNLIAGVIKPNKGKVLINKRKPNLADITYIAQTPWIFEGTIRDNLCLGEKYSDKELMKILEKVGLVAELGENILNRKINPTQENISGGQKQRLVIARALLRNKSIILLDEITAALDDKNSDKIRELVYQVPGTIIESAHHINNRLLDKYSFVKKTVKDQKLI